MTTTVVAATSEGADTSSSIVDKAKCGPLRSFVVPEIQPGGAQKAAAESSKGKATQREAHLKKLQRLLERLLSAKPPERNFQRSNEVEDPSLVPVIWITKWVDYTEVHGLGYEFSDNSVLVNFNDDTRMILLNNKQNVIYTEHENTEGHYSLEKYPPSLEHKITLLKHFGKYMKDYLVTTGEDISRREPDSFVSLPYVETWMRSESAISFYLTNGTVQRDGGGINHP
ncbi:serine/threonine-protein kinase PLK1-like [Dermacentor silvarum]|uniref:serine/threonine-protein kinase PLK1-like n=1 Tax=Dermacentor silvarum TaxID=543639 RepID=UPI00189AC582|nr:serine/threonine-protein kinase PLK1-like [Dermacentor silvarum]